MVTTGALIHILLKEKVRKIASKIVTKEQSERIRPNLNLMTK